MKFTQSQLDKLYEARNNLAQDYIDAGGRASIYHTFQHGFDACLKEIEKMNDSIVCGHSGYELPQQTTSVSWDLQSK